MIDLYFAPTPNGWKISVMLEECELPYQVKMIDIGRGDQFDSDFLRISPSGKIPAIVDNAPIEETGPISVFETGAILIYLAQKSGKLLPSSAVEQKSALEWLFWQTSALGPMMGQHGHFKLFAPEHIDYAVNRYRREVLGLFEVLDSRLATTHYLAGENYSIADIASFPWVQIYKAQGIDLPSYQHTFRWYQELKQRPALRRGMALGREQLDYSRHNDPVTKKTLFGIDDN